MTNKLKITIVVLICLLPVLCFAESRWYQATSLIGGTSGSLDSINGQNLNDLDKAIVISTAGTYFYNLDADASGTESSPGVINPDSNKGTKSWILESVKYDLAFSTFVDEDATPSVANEDLFYTNTTTGTPITGFDDGMSGQLIFIISKGAITFDTTSNARLTGSSADLVTASGDTMVWLCETGGTTSSVWRLISFADASDDNS